MRDWRPRVGVTMVCVMVLGLIGGYARPTRAGASLCRTDPKFFFGNGDKLTIVATVGVPHREITKIKYVVHAPAEQADDQAEVRIVFTGLPPGVEEAEVRFDLESMLKKRRLASHAYLVEAVAFTTGKTASATFAGSLNQQSAQQVSGVTGELLWLAVAR
jgi:hypothetical protein